MSKIYQKITDLIGGTPLLELANYEKKNNLEATVLGKLEYFNPAGSVKDRIAKAMVDEAEQEGKLKQQLVDIYGDNIKESNTVLSYDVSVEKREEELKRKFNEFKSAKLIVTDRLHGMVFAAITGTNCIVINSKSPKMKGCYDWIKDLDYIAFIDDVENIDKIIDNFPDYPHEYDNKEFVKAIDKMISEIEV